MTEADRMAETQALKKEIQRSLHCAMPGTVVSYDEDSRLTEKDAQAVSTYLSAYVRETPGVLDVRDEQWEFSGNRLLWSCTAVTEYGKAEVQTAV